MRVSSLFRPATAGFSTTLKLWPLWLLMPKNLVDAITVTPVALPDFDLASLGRTALTGNFDAVSLFSYTQQAEVTLLTNGSQSLLTPLPNSVLATLSTADASILTMCPFTQEDGIFAGLYVGGNFTSLGGVEAQGIARYDPAAGTVTSLPGLSGTVLSLLCDQETNAVYVGGDFTIDNSSNAAAWLGTNGWSSLPFGGFNGPVTSILQADNGHIIFGGSFDGLGNTTTPTEKDSQVINLQAAAITSDANSNTPGFDDPRNIICKTSGSDGAENTWLLADDSSGFWRADARFGFRPSKLRLYNTHLNGRGTKTFRFQALPINGIMNLTYTDPATGQDNFCDATCPLSNNQSEIYRDFRFVNSVGMNGFILDISAWYGQGAGLDGIELFENDMYAYAINDFNEPSCASISFPSTATRTGPWTVTPSGQSNSDYLSAKTTQGNAADVSITFLADIKQSGNYSVILYTPGCIQDDSCASRGIVNVTGTFAPSTRLATPLQTPIYQTNYYDKYDTIYTGYVDANSNSFRSSVTLSPLSGQENIDIVAMRVGFHLIASTGGLNGLFEYDPNAETVNSDFATSTIDLAGTQLEQGASISCLATYSGAIYVGGNFSDSVLQNIFSVSGGNATSLPDGGLNSQVDSMLVLNDTLYVGGNFTGTLKRGSGNLARIAAYSASSKAWSALGAGLNGPVTSVLSFPVNVSTNVVETAVAVSGDFDQILAFDNNSAIPVSGFAIWVPSQANWLQNLDVYQMSYRGKLTVSAAINNDTFLAGSLVSDGIASTGAVSLINSNGLTLEPLPLHVQQITSTSPLTKRAISSSNVTGIATGIFETSNGRNLTILGGQFTATGSDGSVIQNLLFFNGSNSDTNTGLPPGVDSNSSFVTLAVQGDILFAGGTVTGNASGSPLNGFVAYNLTSIEFVTPPPPPLTGANVTVNSIAVRPGTTEVYFGGIFDSAGALPCPTVCFFDTSDGQWSRPGVAITGEISTLRWASSSKLIATGNLTVGGNQTMVATYDASQQAWSSIPGASPANLPGPVTAFSPSVQDVSQFWVAGRATNGSSFVVKYDGSLFHSIGNIFDDKTTILSIQVLGLSANHPSTNLLNGDQLLLITGKLGIPGFGLTSAAIYNGTTLTAFLLSTSSDGEPGSISQLFTEYENTFSGIEKHLSRGIIILISFCLALGCVFLIVALGIILSKIQRHRQGYVRAPQTLIDRPTSLRRVPPEYLFGSLKHDHTSAPVI